MTNTTTYSFCDSFIERLADDIVKNYGDGKKDLSRVAVVFGGKRPAMFLKRALAKRLKIPFTSLTFFTIDDFIRYTVRKNELFEAANDLDHCYLIYNLARKVTPEILIGRETFAQFLPWTQELLGFIDHLDLEMVEDERLKNIQANAQIGYGVPEDINRLLQGIVELRREYHQMLKKSKAYSRGYQYRRAAEVIAQVSFGEFDEVLFCNFFYFNRTEEIVVEELLRQKKARLIFQGDERKWPVLKRISGRFDCAIQEGKKVDEPKFDLKLYSAKSQHAQVTQVRNILQEIKNPHDTVIVLPHPDLIMPLVTQAVSSVKEFNISMGYPLKRSSLFALFESVFRSQISRHQNGYYTRDYLSALRHPFVKNLMIEEFPRTGGSFRSTPAVTRILVHKLEEILTGQDVTDISGRIFINLKDIEQHEPLFDLSLELLKRMNERVTKDELKQIVIKLHDIVFRLWEDVDSFEKFAGGLGEFLDVFVRKSFLKNYPLNLNIAQKIYGIRDELLKLSFRQEIFPKGDIFKIFESKIGSEMVAFSGSPLKGLQILGLFETRSLNFENVIVVDANEGVLPTLKIHEPLIPREVMISLNLNRIELEEEIQRYLFMRLISSAKKVHLVYQENKEKERSRFVEELIWEAEKNTGRLGSLVPVEAGFLINIKPRIQVAKKTPQMIEFLKNHTFSASSINKYLNNPLDFYYQYVLGLREQDDLLDEPESREVGTFVHELLEEAFKPYLGRKPEFNAQFKERFFRLLDQRFDDKFGKSIKSGSYLIKSVLVERLARFIHSEDTNLMRQVEQILNLENDFATNIPFSFGLIKFKLVIDRVDLLGNKSIELIDYKTGSIDQMPKNLSVIESMVLSRESIRDNVRSFQIPLYFYYLTQAYPGKKINAALYNLRTMDLKYFIDEKAAYPYEKINQVFLRALDFVMSEILDPNVDFVEDLQARKF